MKLLVVSNMYPDRKHPSYGVFVKKFCNEIGKIGIEQDRSVMHKSDTKIGKIINYVCFFCKTYLKVLLARYDAVYVHYASHSSCAVIMASRIRHPIIYTNVHGSDVIPENKKQEKMQKYTSRILGISDKVIVPSEYFKKIVIRKYAVDERKVYIYPSAGVDKAVFHKAKDSDIKVAQEKYGIDSQLTTFGFVGRISAGKGWDTYLNAIRIFIDSGLKANFVLIGDGGETMQLQELVDELKIGKSIIYDQRLLAQSELATIFSMLDFFVFPTRRSGESLGLVALEAMACETPVISSCFAAPKYYMKDGDNGYTFSVEDAKDLSRCMERGCKARGTDEYSKMSVGALETAREYFPDNIRDSLNKIFD